MEWIDPVWGNAGLSGWWAGKLPDTDQVLGLSLFWWSRIGKLLQLVAAFVIVVDLIGARKLRRLGKSLHVPVNVVVLKQLGREAITWVNLIWSKGPTEAAKLSGGRGLRLIKFLNPLLSVLIAYLLWMRFGERLRTMVHEELPGWAWDMINSVVGQSILKFALFAAVSVTIGPVVSSALTMGPLALARSVELLLNGIAWVLSLKNVEKILQVAFFVVFLLGFLLDMLAS